METFGPLLKALKFAAEKHRLQQRKGKDHLPYINHLIDVAYILNDIGKIEDENVLLASILHDTIEDTETTKDEIMANFGPLVGGYVLEVTDDKQLPKATRKQLQIDKAAHLSYGAKLIKLADKSSNVKDIAKDPPEGWHKERIIAYLDWAERVVSQLAGTHSTLETHFQACLHNARQIYLPID